MIRNLIALTLLVGLLTADGAAAEIRVFAAGIGVTDAIVEFDNSGFPVATPVSFGPTDSPRGMTILGDQLFVALEGASDSITRYDLDGSNAKQIFSERFRFQMRVESSQGLLYAADRQGPIYRLTPDGDIQLTIEPAGNPFGIPFIDGVDADSDGNIYAVLRAFDPSGNGMTFLDKYSPQGTRLLRVPVPDAISPNPNDLAIDERGERLFFLDETKGFIEYDIRDGDIEFVREISPGVPNALYIGMSYHAETDRLFVTGSGFTGQFTTDGDLVQRYFMNFSSAPTGMDIVAFVPEPQFAAQFVGYMLLLLRWCAHKRTRWVC